MKIFKESTVPIIQKRDHKKRIPRTFRLKPELVDKLSKIAKQTGESRTYVLESLLEYAIKAYEKERKTKDLKR
jgi:predicted DNA-binding protein